MLFIEIPIFTKLVSDLLPDDEYRIVHSKPDKATKRPCKGVATMKENEFNNLVKSIKQAGQIKRGQLKPNRTFEFRPLDNKKIREKLKKS